MTKNYKILDKRKRRKRYLKRKKNQSRQKD